MVDQNAKDFSEGSEEYEILPHAEIQQLRTQLKDVKSNYSPEHSMQASIERLTRSMNSMMSLFRTAEEELKLESHDRESFKAQIDPLMRKLDEISDQNEKIAEGIISLVELMKKNEIKIEQQIKETVYRIPDMMDKRVQQSQPVQRDSLFQSQPVQQPSFPQQFSREPLFQQPSLQPQPAQQSFSPMQQPNFPQQQFSQPRSMTAGNLFADSSTLAPPKQEPVKKKGLFGR